jgi:glycosyltransferase involved in cell wall biosynthesis
VEVVTSYASGYFGELLARDGIPIHELHLAHKYDPQALPQLTGLLRRGDYDVVHAHGWPEILFVALASLLVHGPRYVLSEHNVTNRRRRSFLKPLDRFMYSRYHRIVAVSQTVADALIAWLPEVAPRVTVVHNGVEPTRLNPSPDARQTACTELGIPNDVPLILSGGGLEYRKGVDVLLQALAQVYRHRGIGNESSAVCLVAGDGPLRPNLQALAHQLGLRDQVRFLGFRPDLPAVMAAADLLVLSSRWEGCPMVVLEAMALGLPIVATSVGGVPELITDGETGLLVPPENPLALGQAVLRLLSNRELAVRLGQAARERLNTVSHARNTAHRLATIYHEVRSERRSARMIPEPAILHRANRRSQTAHTSASPMRNPCPKPSRRVQHAMHNLLHRYAALRGYASDQTWDWVLDEPLLVPFVPTMYYAAEDDTLPLSESALQRVRLAYYATAAANLLRYRELGDVLGAFNDAGIPTIVLKGAVLAEDLYPNIALRPMSDVDLLVPYDRVPEAREVLERLGYQPEAAVLTPWGSVDQVSKSIGMFTKEAADDGQPMAVVVDLHWNLINTYWLKQATYLDMAEFWERARPIELSGQPTHQLCPEDTLLHLCIHQALKHHLIDLKDYLDIDQLVRSGRVDWESFVERAQVVRFRAACYHALRFTQSLFSTPIPDWVMVALRPDPLRRWLVSHFVTPEKRLLNDLTISVSKGFLLNLLMADRWQDLAHVCLSMLWPDTQWLSQRHRMAGVGRLHPRLWHLRRLVRYVLALLKRSSPGMRQHLQPGKKPLPDIQASYTGDGQCQITGEHTGIHH